MPIHFTLEQLQHSLKLVRSVMPPTPQYQWPQLCEHLGIKVWVKHENHTPTGAFKVRGAITFMEWLKQAHPKTKGIVTATRGNHGQGQARAASALGLSAKIVVPYGNSLEKNAAMRSFGGIVEEYGKDFNEACLQANRIAQEEELFMVPAFHHALLTGVATYGMELLQAVKDLDSIYVPIGCGSGICSLILLRDLMGLKTEIVGVVSTEAAAAKLSVESGKIINTDSANTFADGVAVRKPIQEAFDIYSKGVSRVIAVSDDEIAQAMRLYYRYTHNVAEGAGAAPLAALLQEHSRQEHGKNVAVILCGGNVDTDIFQQVLSGITPSPRS